MPNHDKTRWILDCDNTLYPPETRLFEHVDRRIDEYMTERLGLGMPEVEALRRRYRAEHGITLSGLMADYRIDPEEYLAYVHHVPVEAAISPDPLLASALERLPGERVIFTNGSRAHAERILARLGTLDLFADIYDIAFMDYVPKPKAHGYRKLLDVLGAPAASCVFVDDSAENLDTGRALGMTTVLVGPRNAPGHMRLSSPRELPAAFAALLPG